MRNPTIRNRIPFQVYCAKDPATNGASGNYHQQENERHHNEKPRNLKRLLEMDIHWKRA
jgi:hypothetical protein